MLYESPEKLLMLSAFIFQLNQLTKEQRDFVLEYCGKWYSEHPQNTTTTALVDVETIEPPTEGEKQFFKRDVFDAENYSDCMRDAVVNLVMAKL